MRRRWWSAVAVLAAFTGLSAVGAECVDGCGRIGAPKFCIVSAEQELRESLAPLFLEHGFNLVESQEDCDYLIRISGRFRERPTPFRENSMGSMVDATVKIVSKDGKNTLLTINGRNAKDSGTMDVPQLRAEAVRGLIGKFDAKIRECADDFAQRLQRAEKNRAEAAVAAAEAAKREAERKQQELARLEAEKKEAARLAAEKIEADRKVREAELEAKAKIEFARIEAEKMKALATIRKAEMEQRAAAERQRAEAARREAEKKAEAARLEAEKKAEEARRKAEAEKQAVDLQRQLRVKLSVRMKETVKSAVEPDSAEPQPAAQ